MELEASFFALAVPAVVIAGMSKGGFGAGAAFVATPLLAIAIEPVVAVGLMLPLLMLMDVAGLRAYWGKWNWGCVRHLMAGAVPGVAIGWLTFRHVSADGLRLLVGAIAVSFALYQIAQLRGLIRPAKAFASGAWGWFWGAVAGFASFVSHAGGPPAAMYLLGNRLSKTEYQACTVIALWWINLLKFPGYAMLGLFTAKTLAAVAILAPVGLLGVHLGVRLHRVIPDWLYFSLAYSLLILAGLKLILDALI